MGIKRIVDTSFWTDGKMDEFSPEDKYFWLYLLTNPFSKQLGIYELSVKQAAFQMGYSIDAFNVLLDRFENKYRVIVFSKETNEVAILNFLRHSVIKGGKPVEDCIRKEMTLVKNRRLIDIVFSRLHGRDDLNDTVKKIVAEYMKENDIHNDNDNDNDNDNENERTHFVSCDVSCDDTPTTPPAPIVPDPEEPVRHKHGANGWVRLTDEQYIKLLKDLGPAELNRCITYVDESAQITQNKNGWKDWNLVVRRCHREQWGTKYPKQKASEQPVQRKKTFSEILAEKKAGGAL